MALKDEIANLKYKLQTAEDFGDVWTAFFDLSNRKIFTERSQPVRRGDMVAQEVITEVLKKIGEQYFGFTVAPTNFLLLELQPYQMLHGPFTLHNRFGTVIYFKDIDIGMAAIIKSFHSSETHFTRFTLMLASQQDPKGFLHAPKSKRGH